jgi:hypothetical protein
MKRDWEGDEKEPEEKEEKRKSGAFISKLKCIQFGEKLTSTYSEKNIYRIYQVFSVCIQFPLFLVTSSESQRINQRKFDTKFYFLYTE